MMASDDTKDTDPPRSDLLAPDPFSDTLAARRPAPARRRAPAAAFTEAFADPWADWRPVWTAPARKKKHRKPQSPGTARGGSVHDQQETHSPTEGVALRVSAERQHIHCQRRIVDARLWEAMTPAQQDAALAIARAFETMGRGLGYVSSDWERIPGGRGPGNIADAHSRLLNNYIDWTKACHKAKISHAMIIDVLVFGFSCRALDRDRRVRSGTSRQNLMDGLTLYCLLQGWPTR